LRQFFDKLGAVMSGTLQGGNRPHELVTYDLSGIKLLRAAEAGDSGMTLIRLISKLREPNSDYREKKPANLDELTIKFLAHLANHVSDPRRQRLRDRAPMLSQTVYGLRSHVVSVKQGLFDFVKDELLMLCGLPNNPHKPEQILDVLQQTTAARLGHVTGFPWGGRTGEVITACKVTSGIIFSESGLESWFYAFELLHPRRRHRRRAEQLRFLLRKAIYVYTLLICEARYR
jgi:hypothetical protein